MEPRLFELTITAIDSQGKFRIAAASSHQGHAEERGSLNREAWWFETLASLLERPLGLADLRRLGTALFELIFPGRIGALFRIALGDVLLRDEERLRILLRIELPELTILPWEMLFDPERELFLATSPKTTISRTLSLIEPIRTISVPETPRVLLLTPQDHGLPTGDEALEVEAQLRKLAMVDRLTGQVTRSLVREALRDQDYHLVHYAGHGSFSEGEAFIYLNHSEKEHPDLVPATAFADFFLDYPSIRLVCLNACEGATRSSTEPLAGMAPQLLRRGVPAVIAMQTPMTSSEATLFSVTFYSELIQGPQSGNVESALARARGALFQERFHDSLLVTPIFASPVLYLRARDGQLWQGRQSRTESVSQKLSAGAAEKRSGQEPLFRKAVARFLLEDYRGARTSLEELVHSGGDPRYLLNLGYLLYIEGRYPEALETFVGFIEEYPYSVEAYLNAFKTCLVLRDLEQARLYCAAAVRLAPARADVKKARALYLLETGDVQAFLRTMGEVPDTAIFNRPADADLERIRNNASVLVGEERVSVMIAVFAGSGLRTVLLGYRNDSSALPRPRESFRWFPLGASAREKLSTEVIDIEADQVSMIGFRVNGLEQEIMQEPQGFLIADFHFSGLRTLPGNLYAGLMLVDWDRQLRLEPRQIHVRDLLVESKGDLVDLWQDLLRPVGTFVGDQGQIPRVFMSYAAEDAEVVEWISQGLTERGLDIWKDKVSLRIGDRYENKIDEAIDGSDYAIVCLSAQATSKSGFVQRELRRILESARLRPLDYPFILPLRLDECEVPRQLREFHWLDIGPDREAFLNRLAEDILMHYKMAKA